VVTLTTALCRNNFWFW